jgi:hypothetical protein
MKKKYFIAIIFVLFILLIIGNLVYYIFYFKHLRSNIQYPTEDERTRVVELLHENNFTTFPRTEFRNIYRADGTKIIEVRLEENGTIQTYLVDLNSQRIIKR